MKQRKYKTICYKKFIRSNLNDELHLEVGAEFNVSVTHLVPGEDLYYLPDIRMPLPKSVFIEYFYTENQMREMKLNNLLDMKRDTKVTTWETTCRKCNEKIYYYPAKLVIEGPNTPVDMKKRILHLTCCNDCGMTMTYEFPTLFTQIA